jgi:acyl-CoA reductase-like NAD-dependent aldehyde dehydrogenase
MSIIPVLNALVVGNTVEIKPSSKALNFFSHIWENSGIINKYQLPLNCSKEEVTNIIHDMDAVYFFGGFENAKQIAKICAENLIEFHPEIEASDFQIINISDIKDIDKESIKTTIHDSFLHTGQSCQRIQGIYINSELYPHYKDLLIETCNQMTKSGEFSKYIPENYQPGEILINNFQNLIKKETTIEIQKINGEFPYIMSNINPNGELIKSAQFLPTLWLLSYSSQEELLEWIHNRKFRLGVNILSDNKSFIENIVESTRFSRYTINTGHSLVRYNEGWGGISPTGFNGYKSWIEHFSYPFTVIRE